MGLSASQARLLSITARLSYNELESQLLTNAKVRLANESDKARETYLDAAMATKLNFVHYNDIGVSESFDLTPALLYSYEPLKNQYSIQNAKGKNLVTSTEAKNYEETNNIWRFLERYGLVDSDVLNKYDSDMNQYNRDLNQYVLDMNKYNADVEKYKVDWINYKEEWDKYKADYAQYEKDYAQYKKDYAQYEIDYAKYLDNINSTALYDRFVNTLGTSQNPKSCYSNLINDEGDGVGCFEHVLGHLLDWNGGPVASQITYISSIGQSVKLKSNAVSGSNMYNSNKTKGFEEISAALNDTDRVCDGDDNYIPEYSNGGVSDTTKENMIQQAINEGRIPTDLEILSSDYIYNRDTNSVAGIKTLKQKAIDMLYLIRNNSTFRLSLNKFQNILINFVEGDFRKLVVEEPIAPLKPIAPSEPTIEEPIPPIKPQEPTKPIFDAKINDKEKGQWYVNLWYLMNGSNTANLVKNVNNENKNQVEVGTASVQDNMPEFDVLGAEKNSLKSNYEVIDENKLSDAEWLQYALENGMVTLKKTQPYYPSENSGKVLDIDGYGIAWNEIAYTNSEDIYSVENEAAISKAEAEYEKTLAKIESKDNKYDVELKNLDTIHNALQTEYESVKGVIAKNSERSFKIFS